VSEAVLADAQFSTVRILRPLLNFETYYQGQNAVAVPGAPSTPVPFFEVGSTTDGRDPSAGRDGYDANLLNYMTVPLGALIKLWIPFFTDPNDPANFAAYRYMLHWRMSDIVRYTRDLSGQYHIGTQSPGAPDTTQPAGQQKRFVTPSANKAIIINQPENILFQGQNSNVRREYLVFRTGDAPAQPLLAAGVRGVYQQGIVDPAVDPLFAPLSAFVEVEVVAGGDRMLITADREGVEALPWDFESGGDDAGFSNIYGTSALDTPHPPFPFVGIYASFGSAP